MGYGKVSYGSQDYLKPLVKFQVLRLKLRRHLLRAEAGVEVVVIVVTGEVDVGQHRHRVRVRRIWSSRDHCFL